MFYENEEGVLFKTRLYKITETILNGVPVVYALTNTNIAGINVFKTH